MNHNTPQFLEVQDCWLQVIDPKKVFVLFLCFHPLVFYMIYTSGYSFIIFQLRVFLQNVLLIVKGKINPMEPYICDPLIKQHKPCVIFVDLFYLYVSQVSNSPYRYGL